MNRHFLFIGRDGAGHVNPTLPVVDKLIRRGHRVTYAVGAPFAEAVQLAGAKYLALPENEFRHGSQSGQSALRDSNTDVVEMITDLLIEHAGRELPVLRDGFAADPPDAICYDTNSLAGAMLAAIHGIPAAQLRPGFAANEHYTPLQEFVAGPDRLTTSLAAADARVRAYTSSYGITGSLATVVTPGLSDLTVVFVPREFQYRGETFGEGYVFVGPSEHDRVESGSWDPPAAGARLLFISLGTLMNQNLEFFRLCVDAFADDDWLVAMAIGDRIDRAELGEIPANFDVRAYFPQLEVLKHADVFLTHAGMNSAMEAVLNRVPTVAVPQMPEQQGNARRLSELGLGVLLVEQSASALRFAVSMVDGDHVIRENLLQMAELFRNAGGATAAADAIEALTG